MAVSKTDIFNMALASIGDALISDPDGQEKGAEYCSQYYDTVRRQLLREYPWNFATKRSAPALSGTPAYGYQYAYTLPTDCLAWRELSDDNYDWEVESGELLTDMEDATGKYTLDVEDPNQFDSLFVPLFAKRLAIEVVTAIKPQDGKKLKLLWDQAEAILADAKYADAVEKKKRPEPENKYVESRDYDRENSEE